MATGYSVMDALNKNSKAGVDESPRARFRTKDISIFKIYSNSLNFYPQDGIEEKAGEILSVGLLENLAVKYEPCEKGDYKLISGERRWRGLKLLVEKGYKDFELVSCQVRSPQNEHEEKIEIIIANSSRQKTIAVMIQEEQELKAELEYMKENKLELRGYDLQSGRLRDVISSILKMSKTKIAQIESVNNNLIPEFKEELNKERLTFSAAYALSGMSSDEQREALEKYSETGELSFIDICDMKEAKAAEAEKAQVEGQMSMDDMQKSGEAAGQQVSDSDTGELKSDKTDGKEEHPAAGEEYKTPHPVEVTSICYSCKRYSNCNVRRGTCLSCDQYINKAEADKTDEQRYSEEQDAIDRETSKKLREKADEERMNNIPSDAAAQQESGKKYLRAAGIVFERIVNGEQHFMIVKNDGFKTGEEITIGEFSDGRATGRTLEMVISFMEDDNTSSAIENGYCIINILEAYRFCEQCEYFDMVNVLPDGMSVCSHDTLNHWCEEKACHGFKRKRLNVDTKETNENGESLDKVDLKQMCEDIRANGDGYIEGGDEYIMIEKAVDIVAGKGIE